MINFILKTVAFVFIADFYLYWQHRALHKFLMRIHSIHHRKKYATIFHPLEHVLNWGLFPIGWLIGFTTNEMLLVLIWTIIFTFISHNEKKPRPKKTIFMQATDHEKHHDLTVKNYGVVLKLWDRLMRTYA